MLCQIPRCNDGFEIDIDTQHIWLGWGTGGWEFGVEGIALDDPGVGEEECYVSELVESFLEG
jgi:hypothetical protein